MLAASAALLLVPVILALVLARWNGVAGYRAADAHLRRRDSPPSTAMPPASCASTCPSCRCPPGRTEVKVEMGAGEVDVTVPVGRAPSRARPGSGIGEFNLLGRSQAGLSLDGEVHSTGSPAPRRSRSSAGRRPVSSRSSAGSPPATCSPCDNGQAVRLSARGGRRSAVLSPDGYATPALECLVSGELQTMCRPPGQPLEVRDFPGDRTGLRSCTVPAGGGLSTCTPVPETTEETAPAPRTRRPSRPRRPRRRRCRPASTCATSPPTAPPPPVAPPDRDPTTPTPTPIQPIAR